MAQLISTRPQATLGGVNPFLLSALKKLAERYGPISIESGYRASDYSAKVGGYANDPHSRGEAVDAYIGNRPIGEVIPLDVLRAAGLEGGNTPGFYPGHGNGGRDAEHVQIPGSGVNKSMRSPALGQATGNPAYGNVAPTNVAGSSAGATPLQIIKSYAPTVGLDPAAVVAYALTQGGTSWGAVGDQGTSFGPFQAHIGGAAGNRSPQAASSWANSPQGLTAMMNMMAHAGATGRKGPEAAAYIVGPSFGRGANPASDEAKARAAYAQAASLVGGAAQSTGPAAMAPGPASASPGLSAVSEQLIGPGYAYVKGSPPGSLAAVQRPAAAAQPAPKTLSFGPARPSASGPTLPSSVAAALKALGR